MGQIAVNWRETFDAETAPPTAKNKTRDDRYDLAKALRIIRRMDTSPGRQAVFEEIKAKNPLYRLVDALYATAGARAGQPLVLFAYMLKCVLSLGPFDVTDGVEAVSVSNFPNEAHSIDRLAALVPEAKILRLSLRRDHPFKRGQLRAARQLVASIGRIWPFLSRLARSHGFMPSARIASGLAYYIRFERLFADRPELATAIVASNYSPEALGLVAAAHQMGRRVIYINHAPVPANAALIPPVLADCAVFYGDAVRRTYERRSRCTAEVALIGQPWISRPMEWRDEVRTVGIFLTALTRPNFVVELVSAIRTTYPGVRILIRNHPVALLQTDFSELKARDANLQITLGAPLDEEIVACDLIICGNSGVAMNVLGGGRPVAYMGALDGLPFDYNGFVGSGLVCDVKGWSSDIQARLKRFYFNPRWYSVMRSYDASYDADAAKLERTVTETIRRYLATTPAQIRAAFPAGLRA